MDSMQVMVCLLLTVNVILPATIANHRNSGSCVAAGHHGCCTSGCRVNSCYCDQRCYRKNDCCADIEQIGCYRHGTSFGTSELLSSTVILTSQLLTTSEAVTMTSQLSSTISPTTATNTIRHGTSFGSSEFLSSTVILTTSQLPTTSEAVAMTRSRLSFSPTTTTLQSDTPSLIRPSSSTPEHESLPLPTSLPVSETQESSIATASVHAVMTRRGHPPHDQSVTCSHSTLVHTSSINHLLPVTSTNSAFPELNISRATWTSLSKRRSTTDDYSTNNQLMQISTTINPSEKLTRILSLTKSTWIIQPSITQAISAAQEGLSVPWIILAVTLPLAMIIIAVLIIAIVWCFAIKKRVKNTSFSDITNRPSATTVHELSYVQQSSNQNTEHIYSVPQHFKREACSSMIYNQAYKESFAITINTAYTPTMKRSD